MYNTDVYHFVQYEMRMSAIYQPVIIKELIKSEKGVCSLESIAKVISRKLHGDHSKSDYYIGKLKGHPNKVLKKHGIAEIIPKSGEFSLLDVVGIVPEMTSEIIIKVCTKKIKEYLDKKKAAL